MARDAMMTPSFTPLPGGIPAVIAIDGGGSTCRIVLARAGQAPLAATPKGSANVHTDETGALAVIATGLAELSQRAGLDAGMLRAIPAYAGLAGVMDTEGAARIAAALPFARVVVEDDRPAAVAGALGDRDGAVAGIGTGSFLARRVGGQIRLAGGYGLALGDEASGAWLGRALLGRCLHLLDGLAEATPLLDQTLARFNRSAAAIVAFSGTARPNDYGALTPALVTAAKAGDPAARDLMGQGAAYIARALGALGHRPGEALCLTGGLGPFYRPYLPEGLAVALTDPVGSPLDGAVALAWETAARP